ncbi:hypothetical protein F2P81_011991 [Scophthalmus maximus]|uniref:Uncharacterized protein n=1 Tax=Scophthalmus maximus TaxID=52904 RepID=A0A6A4SVI8_SCOMX|nr:hypothetical protein F2P81_011991 [Scophthalmus maximus]
MGPSLNTFRKPVHPPFKRGTSQMTRNRMTGRPQVKSDVRRVFRTTTFAHTPRFSSHVNPCLEEKASITAIICDNNSVIHSSGEKLEVAPFPLLSQKVHWVLFFFTQSCQSGIPIALICTAGGRAATRLLHSLYSAERLKRDRKNKAEKREQRERHESRQTPALNITGLIKADGQNISGVEFHESSGNVNFSSFSPQKKRVKVVAQTSVDDLSEGSDLEAERSSNLGDNNNDTDTVDSDTDFDMLAEPLIRAQRMSEVMVWQQATGNTTPFISALPGLREERLRNVRRCGSSSLFLFMCGEPVNVSSHLVLDFWPPIFLNRRRNAA